MSENELNLKWVEGGCQHGPYYLSSSKICFSSDNAIRIRDVAKRYDEKIACPTTDISCMATLPFLGVIAVSDTGRLPTIRVFQYPSFEPISQMCRGLDVAYIAMCFAGLDYLVTVGAQPGGEITLWHWMTGQSLFLTSPSCCYRSSCTGRLSLNPSLWYQMCLEQSVSLTLLEIKGTAANISISQRSVILPEDRRQSCSTQTTSQHNHKKRVSVASHCWISSEKIAVSCDDGTVMSVDVLDLTIKVLYCFEDNLITSLAYNNDGLFLGSKDGYVLWVDINKHKFKLLETLNIGSPVKHLTFCPTFEKLTILTTRGGVFVYELEIGNLCRVVPANESPIVGICMLFPDSRYCVTARSNGLLQVWCTVTGKLVAWFQVEENACFLTSSPSSATVLVSTVGGYLYFLSLTNLHQIRVASVFRPYTRCIEHVAFDNYGRYITIAARKEIIHILGGQPSFNFQEVGNRKSFGHVIDVSLCTPSEFKPTVAMFLVRSDLCHRQDIGDTLVKMDLPEDLLTDPLKYRFDVLGTLSEAALAIQTWHLDTAASKIAVHSSLGALVYSPISYEVNALQIWPNSNQNAVSPVWVLNLSSSLVICDMKLAPDHNLLVTVDGRRRVCVFGLWDSFGTMCETEILGVQEGTSKLAISQMGNDIVVCSESGLISCLYWDICNILGYGVFSPWVLKCKEVRHIQESILKKMAEKEEEENNEEEKRVPNTGGESSVENDIRTVVNGLMDNLRTLFLMLNLITEQNRIHRVQELGHSASIHEHQCHDEYLSKLSLDNFMRLRKRSEVSLDEEPLESRDGKDDSQQDTLKALRSTLEVSSYDLTLHLRTKNQRLENVENLYDGDNIAEDLERNLKLIYIAAPRLPLDVTELHSVDKKLNLIQRRNNLIFSLKLHFNEKFAAFCKTKRDVFHEIREKVHRMIEISSLIDIDEPFWECRTSQVEFELLDSFGIYEDIEDGKEISHTSVKKFDSEIELRSLPPKPKFMSRKSRTWWNYEENIEASKYEMDVKEVKDENLEAEFQYLKKSVEESIVQFDKRCCRIQELKTLCNFLVYDLEMQIFILLLWCTSDVNLNAWICHIKRFIVTLQCCDKPSKTAMYTMEDMSNNCIEFYESLKHLERKMEEKISKDCSVLCPAKSESLYVFLQRRPHVDGGRSKNPFLPLSPKDISKSVLTSELERLGTKQSRPKGVDKTTWKALCESRVWKFTAEQVLAWLALHICNINGVLLKWKDFVHEIGPTIQMMSHLLTKLSAMQKKVDETAQALLHWKQEIEVVLMTDLSSPSSTLKPQQMSPWQAIRQGNLHNKQLQTRLEQLEERLLAFGAHPKISATQMQLTETAEFEAKMKTLQGEMKLTEENISTDLNLIKPVFKSLIGHADPAEARSRMNANDFTRKCRSTI